jgi:cytochrome c5
MKRFLKFLFAFIILTSGGIIIYLLFTGPRMRVQPNIRSFQMITPVMSANSVPVKATIEPLPAKEDAQKMANPLDANTENIAKGKIYYGYYCGFCHGEKGDGLGPVGHSYNPVPADLRIAKVQSQSDGQLLLSMLTGIGHFPVLHRVVLPQYRWYIVLYVRQFSSQSQTARPAATDSN